MKFFHRLILASILIVVVIATACARRVPLMQGPSSPDSAYIHGTVVVVISTRDGFVLAGDSRGTETHSTKGVTYADDTEKVFQIGGKTACVVAGTLGSYTTDSMGSGTKLSDAVATRVHRQDDRAKTRGLVNPPIDTTLSIERGFEGVVELIRRTPISDDIPRLEASIVSFDSAGVPFWRTIDIKAVPMIDAQGRLYFAAGPETSVDRRGLAFDYVVLGYPDIAIGLLGQNGPTSDPNSQQPIVQKYYSMKKDGILDQMDLKDAVLLARTLVQDTIQCAPLSAGVGGPVDVLQLTPQGASWIEKKLQTQTAPVDPPFVFRVFGGEMTNSGQDLDGYQCIRCIFHRCRFWYFGSGPLGLIDPYIDGTCTLRISKMAESRRAEDTKRLVDLFTNKCQIVYLPDDELTSGWVMP